MYPVASFLGDQNRFCLSLYAASCWIVSQVLLRSKILGSQILLGETSRQFNQTHFKREQSLSVWTTKAPAANPLAPSGRSDLAFSMFETRIIGKNRRVSPTNQKRSNTILQPPQQTIATSNVSNLFAANTIKSSSNPILGKRAPHTGGFSPLMYYLGPAPR